MIGYAVTVTPATPTQERPEDSVSQTTVKDKRRGCVRWIKRLNDETLKPFLIYNYDKEEAKEERNFYHNFIEQGEKMAKMDIIYEEKSPSPEETPRQTNNAINC